MLKTFRSVLFIGIGLLLIFISHKIDIIFSKVNEVLLISSSEQNYFFADIHNSVLFRMFSQQDFNGLNDLRFPVNLDGLKKSHCVFIILSLGIPRFEMNSPNSPHLDEVLTFFKDFKTFAEKNYPELVFINHEKDIFQLILEKKITYAFALEGAHLLEGDVDKVDLLYEAGIKMVSIAHRFHDEFLIESSQNESNTGTSNSPSLLNDQSMLSVKGIELLKRLLEKKIIIDVSHLPETAFWQVVELNAYQSILVASHSNVYALCPSARNLKDSQIKAIAKSNGIIGICLHQPLLDNDSEHASIKTIVDHIEYIMKLVGSEYVAIGTDFEGRIKTPSELNRIEKIPNLIKEMQNRGFTSSQIENAMWKNAVRVFKFDH